MVPAIDDDGLFSALDKDLELYNGRYFKGQKGIESELSAAASPDELVAGRSAIWRIRTTPSMAVSRRGLLGSPSHENEAD